MAVRDVFFARFPWAMRKGGKGETLATQRWIKNGCRRHHEWDLIYDLPQSSSSPKKTANCRFPCTEEGFCTSPEISLHSILSLPGFYDPLLREQASKNAGSLGDFSRQEPQHQRQLPCELPT